jgi:TolB protein
MDDTDFELWKAPLDGDAVSNGKAAVRILDRTWEPLWAQLPQAGRLLFSSPATGVRNLWIMPLGPNATPRQVTFVPSATITHSALSPDGSQVAYVSTESGSGQIWVANSDGSGARQLTNNAATNFWPFWSFDGQWVAFTSTRPGPPDIWKISTQGGTPVQVTHSNGFRGDWSPDGRRIVYDTQVFQGGPRERENQVAAVEIAEASSGKVLTQVRAPNLTSPVWSPDGRHISVTAANSVWVIDPETGEQRRAVQFPQGFFALFRAVWTPDGKAVIVNRQERTFRVVLIDNF